MPHPGGSANKIGTRFEVRWTVDCLAQILLGRAEAIRLEPPGAEGDGIEFWLDRGNVREFHQVKRQQAGRGRWSISDLQRVGVLQAFAGHLREPKAQCVFVSMNAADELQELAERAGASNDSMEFERHCCQGAWGTRLTRLREVWGDLAMPVVYDYLRRISVRTCDEVTLRSHTRLTLSSCVDGPADSIAEILFSFAFDSVNKTLDAAALWRHLEVYGHTPLAQGQGEAVTQAVANVTRQYVEGLERELIRGRILDRTEAARVLQALSSESSARGVILIGNAGAGKSTVMLSVIRALQATQVTVLGFRIDRLDPTPVSSQLGRQLDLPTDPAASVVLAAKGGASVLVIDQLDAVSTTSGRSPGFFDCVDDVAQQALTSPSTRLLVACRKFDYEHDHRLRRLDRTGNSFETIEVGPLTPQSTAAAMRDLGLDPDKFPKRQLDLLAVPGNLKLMSEIAHEPSCTLFSHVKDLYDLFWDTKHRTLQRRMARRTAFVEIVDALSEELSRNQTLSAPCAVLDSYQADVDAMVSEHVLVRERDRIAFFHEGFFDYAFARRFTARNQRILQLLTSGGQHLFRRAQVRQILAFERDADRSRYLHQVGELLNSTEVRFHIKAVVIAALAELPDPSADEWAILRDLMRSASAGVADRIWSTIRSAAWFRLLDDLGAIETWLREQDDDTINRGVTLLCRVQRDVPDRVAELLEPFLEVPGAEWRHRLRHVVQWSDIDASRRFFELVLRLTDSGDLDEVGHLGSYGDYLSLLYGVVEKRADWACLAIGRYLRRRLDQANTAGQANPLEDPDGAIHSQYSDHVLVGAAQRAPREFLSEVLPFVLAVVESAAVQRSDGHCTDSVWRYRHDDGGHDLSDHLLWGLQIALQATAAQDPEAFGALLSQLRNSPSETVQFLLLRGFAGNPARFADEGIEYLCADTRRLTLGYMNDATGPARELIGAATASASEGAVQKLEATLLEYVSPWERSKNGCHARGSAQFEFLSAIEPSRRTSRVHARLDQWRRKFGVESPTPRPRGGGGFTRSPITNECAPKLSDEQWLRAVIKYSHGGRYYRQKGEPVGGPHELSQTLEAQAKAEPARFSRLIHRLPDSANPAYFRAVLQGLASARAGAEILDACRRCHALPQRPCGRAICNVMEAMPELPWPDDLIGVLEWYATCDPSPTQEDWRLTVHGRYRYDGDPYSAGLNSVRGAAAHAVRALLETDDSQRSRLLPIIRALVRDPSVAVRACVAATLLGLLVRDRNGAVEFFVELCASDDGLLKTPYVEQFIRYTTETHFDDLEAIIVRMIGSPDEGVARVGARRACIAALGIEKADALARKCIDGAEVLRIGAAEVFAANLDTAVFRKRCEDHLASLFNDPSAKVREAAARCFDDAGPATLPHLNALIEEFLASTAFAEHYDGLMRALVNTTCHLPAAMVATCERFIALVGKLAGDLRSRAAHGAYIATELIMRAYQQANDETMRNRCLGVMDAMLECGAQELEVRIGEAFR